MRSNDKIRFELGYTLTDAKDVTKDRELEGRPTHRGNVALTLRHPEWGVDFMTRLSIVGPRTYFTDDEDSIRDRISTPAYVLWDARLELTLARYVAAFIGGQNLLDAGDPSLLPIAPRTLFVGIGVNAEKK